MALPPVDARGLRVALRRAVAPGSRALLIAFEYAQQLRDGPPFSVEPQEIAELYGGNFAIRELERVDIIGDSPKFSEQGIESLYEVAYCLTRL